MSAAVGYRLAYERDGFSRFISQTAIDGRAMGEEACTVVFNPC